VDTCQEAIEFACRKAPKEENFLCNDIGEGICKVIGTGYPVYPIPGQKVPPPPKNPEG
jgi:hypothetical protein